MTETKPRGNDLSHWNGMIAYPLLAQDPNRPEFASYKMGEGFYIWSAYYQQFNGGKEIGLLRNSYYFWRQRYNGRDQMKFFHDGVLPGEWNNVIDFEDTQVPKTLSTLERTRVLDNLYKSVDEYNKLFGKMPIIYTANWYIAPRFGKNMPAYLKDLDLWVAYYYGAEYYDIMKLQPAIPAPWSSKPGKQFLIHQYSDKGKLAGINSQVDMNLWNGTREEMLAYMGKPNWPVPTWKPRPFSAWVGVQLRYIRSGPGVNFPVVGQKKYKETVTFIKYEKGWAQLQDGNWMFAESGLTWMPDVIA